MNNFIEGVWIKKLETHRDERGYFREIMRMGNGFFKKIGQISVSLTHSKVIKAFHWHKKQDDIFCLLSGKVLVVLFDRRKKSKSFGKLMEFVVSEEDPAIIFIPRGVAHGYKIIGKNSARMLYIMNVPYKEKNPDEYRISFDDASIIGFDWSKRK